VRILWIAALCCCHLAAAARPIVKQFDVRVPMRDGVRLMANLYRPSETGRFPTLLVRTPYGRGADITDHYRSFVLEGYAVMVQDVRGRHDSEGVFRPLQQEGPDGYDTLDWIARQPWSDGKVGMMGGSYLGIVQWKAALQNNPHLKAIFPVVSGDDDYRDRFYSPGGAMKLGNRLNWMHDNLSVPGFQAQFSKYVLHLPLRTADRAATGQTSDMYQTIAAHPAYDAFWKSISTREQLARIRIPVFSVGGWYDNFAPSDLDAFETLSRTSSGHHIVIGPWPHNMSAKFATVDFGPESVVPLRAWQLQWFDHWLKGKTTPVTEQAPARVFVMGLNRWRDERRWPPENVRYTSFYLESKGHANSLDGDGVLETKPARRPAPDQFVYDPRDPVPTAGGAVCCNPRVFPWGPMDQRPVERRADVLVYTSKPLKKDLEVVGPVRVNLWAATSARDTDFTAKLVDLYPDGVARNLTDGILRLRYRQSLEREELATPGEIYRITIDAGVTGNLFRKGHRIRLEISSSNFPRFDRNPNTGGPIPTETRLVKATQSVYHDRQHPSELVLPVVR
jgi:uncharacterized protein